MLNEMYRQLGVSPAVYAFGEEILKGLSAKFAEIDSVAEYNQCKVLAAMQKNRVNATHFAATTGYGYDDEGRDNLERVYADCFHTEAALVRPQITCGTHALTVALSANLLPGDELLSPVGRPYDTLEEVIGIRPSPARWRNTAYTTERSSCWRTAASTMMASAGPSVKRRSSSPSSVPKDMQPVPPFRWSRSDS